MNLFSGVVPSHKMNQTKHSLPIRCQENVYKENKENVELQNKIINVNKGLEQSKRLFKEIDSKNRVQPLNDLRNFTKSRFTVYNDQRVDDEIHENVIINKREEETKAVEKISIKRYDILTIQEAYNIDYTNDFLEYQIELHEKRQLPVSLIKTDITPNQRRLVVKYLIRSIAYKKYSSFVAYQAIKIFDSYIAAVEVKVDDLQIAALAALWIALKKDMIADGIPNATQLLNAFSAKMYQGNIMPLVRFEKSILNALSFEISFPDPFSIYSLLIAMLSQSPELESMKIETLYYYGSYLIDLSLLTFDQKENISAVTLAVICGEISLYLEHTKHEALKNPEWIYWRNTIFKYNPAIKKSCDRIPVIRNQLLQKVIVSKDSKMDYHVVFKKYDTKRYGLISNALTAKVFTLYVNNIST